MRFADAYLNGKRGSKEEKEERERRRGEREEKRRKEKRGKRAKRCALGEKFDATVPGTVARSFTIVCVGFLRPSK
jgi:hypothetical protein